MTNHHFYFWSELELTEYYNLDVSSDNIRPMRAKYHNNSLETDEHNYKTKTAITFAIGLITTLIILSGAQLYNVVKSASVSSTSQKNRTSQIKLDRGLNYLFSKKQQNLVSTDLEKIAIKNAIAKGKF